MKRMIKPITVILIIILLLIVFNVGYILNLKADISNNILRLHIVAESDGVYDQLLKLCVRDRILNKFANEFSSCSSAEEAAKTAEVLKNEIEETAESELESMGCMLSVTSDVSECHFPTKKYGSVILPEGKYTALNIKIGSAGGGNWWCVMYPPLCISDKSVVMSEASKQKLKDILTEEEYELISEDKTPDIKIKFRIAEILGKLVK